MTTFQDGDCAAWFDFPFLSDCCPGLDGCVFVYATDYSDVVHLQAGECFVAEIQMFDDSSTQWIF